MNASSKFRGASKALGVIILAAASTLPALAAGRTPDNLEPPRGSYQNTCVQIIVQRLIGGSGRSLEARCPDRRGNYVDAALPLPCSGDIQNQNGRLLCTRGDNPFAPPRGSYQAMCKNIQLSGPILSARCSNVVPGSVLSSINTLDCKGRDIRVSLKNRLTC